jgi:hypothetical protein
LINILIVEDIPDTVRILRRVIVDEFPDWIIDTAQTIPEAHRLVAEVQRLYDT